MSALSETSHQFWFHCGRCGSLFRSPAGEDASRACPDCGNSPSTGLGPGEPSRAFAARPAAAVMPGVAATVPAASAETSGRQREKPHGGRARRRPRKILTMPVLAAGWVMVLAVIVVLARFVWHDDSDVTRQVSGRPMDDSGSENALLLETAVPLCSQVLSGFLAAGTPEERNQFVRDSLRTASRMARFYSLNPIASLDGAQMKLDSYGVLDFPSGKGVLSRWHYEDGRIFDILFRDERGEWKIDWDHFVLYGDYPWGLFLTGSGPEEGEFRLFARERLAEDRRDADTISLVLSAPRFGHPESSISPSPEILVPRDSDQGRMLDAAFRAVRADKVMFGDRLKKLDPDDLIRVRVRVARIESSEERRFEIRRVEACHWYADGAPGLEAERQDTWEGALEQMERQGDQGAPVPGGGNDEDGTAPP